MYVIVFQASEFLRDVVVETVESVVALVIAPCQWCGHLEKGLPMILSPSCDCCHDCDKNKIN